MQALQTMAQDVREAHDHGCGEIARFEAFDDFVQIDLMRRIAIGTYDDVPRGVDAEVVPAPGGYLVEVERIFDLPGGNDFCANACHSGEEFPGAVNERGVARSNRSHDVRESEGPFAGAKDITAS